MKLGALNSAIRSMKGAPKTAGRFWLEDGAEIVLHDLEITKQSLLAALKEVFPDGRSAETGLRLRDDGHIVADADQAQARELSERGDHAEARELTADDHAQDTDDPLDDLLG